MGNEEVNMAYCPKCQWKYGSESLDDMVTELDVHSQMEHGMRVKGVTKVSAS